MRNVAVAAPILLMLFFGLKGEITRTLAQRGLSIPWGLLTGATSHWCLGPFGKSPTCPRFLIEKTHQPPENRGCLRVGVESGWALGSWAFVLYIETPRGNPDSTRDS